MESAGYAVESYASAEQFLMSASAQNAACLILDIQLPGINGLEVQGKLIGADNRVPIIFVTAQGTQSNRDKAMRRGASGFLSKPFRREDLLRIVGAAIEH